MNSIPTVPSSAALSALTLFSKERAHTQLLLWQRTSQTEWSAASTAAMYAEDYVDDALFALSEAREQHASSHRQTDDEDGFSEPEWCNEAIVEAQETLKHAKKHRNEARELARQLASTKMAAQKAFVAFVKDFPEFQYVAKPARKRSSSSTSFPDDGDNGRDGKRLRPSHTHIDIAGPSDMPTPAERKTIMKAWLASSKTALKDRAAMQTFPEPPAPMCAHSSCRLTSGKPPGSEDRTLTTCKHNLLVAFSGLGTKELKRERHEWHPDRFGACRADERVKWQKMASEIFVAVSGMMRDG